MRVTSRSRGVEDDEEEATRRWQRPDRDAWTFFFFFNAQGCVVCVRAYLRVCMYTSVCACAWCLPSFFFFFTFCLLARLVISTLHSLLNSFVARSQRGIKNACLKTARGEKELDTGFERDGYAFLFAG